MIALLRFWREGLIAVLLLLVAVQTGRLQLRTGELETARANHETYRAQVRQRTAEVLAREMGRVRRIETDQNRITEESGHAYQARIDDLNRRIAALRLRNPVPNGGGAGATAPSGVPGSPAAPDAPAPDPGLS